ncbi:MFS transporter [Anatilimnocola floriformis]|uniref:MFS transporter n=1 Tax=Anatilimnocola floriformis TaxID=2948575 RepID=UPI0020C40D7C|nr:MFS transporter [Anatilimnocola floriformis]
MLPKTLNPPATFYRRLPFYYGWVILPIAALAMTATLPGRTHGIGLITAPLMKDLELTEVEFGWINLWSILLGAAFCWPIGRVLDRFGTRIVLVIVVAALGDTVVATGHVDGSWTLFIALLLTRGLGQGALSVVSTALVGKWFVRRLTLAMGVFAILLGIGFLGSIIGMGVAIKHAGWRAAWEGMGWTLLVGLAPLCALLVRSTPESCGLDSESQLDVKSTESDRADLPLSAALLSPAFWVFTSASCLFNFTWSAVTLFNQAILESRGFSESDFYLVMAIITFVGLIANLLGGWLATRWPLGRLLMLGMILLAVALQVFTWIDTDWQLIAYAVMFGISSGLVTVVHFAFHPQAFGRTHLGQIQGLFQIFSVISSALGPLILAWVKAKWGYYETLFLAIVPLALILGLAAALVPQPVRPLVLTEKRS